jgi:HEAT repeat protein
MVLGMLLACNTSDHLIETLLHDQDSGARRAAARKLAEKLDPDAIHRIALLAAQPHARDALSDMSHTFEVAARSGKVGARGRAVQCLKELGTLSAAPFPLIQNVGNSGIESLGNLLLLPSIPTSLKTEVVASLGAIGSPRSLFALAQGLTSTQDMEVRAAIVDALRLKGEAAIEPLIGAKCDGWAGADLVGIEVMLADIGEPALRPLLSKSETAAARGRADCFDWVLDALARIGSPAVQPLITRMGSQDRDIRLAAATALVKMNSYHSPALASILTTLDRNDLRGIADMYPFFIRLGKSGTEGLLVSALNRYGTSAMCVDYLNAGHAGLEDAARDWARRHGFNVHTTAGTRGGPKWREGQK